MRKNVTLTEKGALALGSTQSKCLDLFTSGLLRKTESKRVKSMVKAAWEEDAVLTMKILLHARDCRGGKGERKVVNHALQWLREEKPNTYRENLKSFIEMGCYRDLLEIASEAKPRSSAGGKKDCYELEMMAEQLSLDFEKLQKKKAKIAENCASKWAPTENGKFDKKYKMAKRLAALLFPESSTARKDYRKMLAALREHLSIVECAMVAKDWKSIDYSKVPARATKLYSGAFRKRDVERYSTFIGDVKKGVKTIKHKGLQPHELVKFFLKHVETLEAQWKALASRIKASGALRDSIAVCDVSGSMLGEPMEASIAMGILVAMCASEPFHGRLITFSKHPQWHKIPVEASLGEMVANLSKMDWGGSTRMDRVFKLIINTAVEYKLPQEALPKTLFVFTDMQFDKGSGMGDKYTTLYEMAKKKFSKHGYELPKVVFWNLRAAKKAFPVDKDAPGVAMVSGFSADLLRTFMQQGDFLTPLGQMLKVVKTYNVAIHKDEE
eukprot:jgi/Bigna1/54241/estExt_Genewise1Plus.C_300121